MSKNYNVFEHYSKVGKDSINYSYAPTEIEVLMARKVAKVLLAGLALAVVGGLYAFFVFAPATFSTVMPVLGVCIAGGLAVYGLIWLVALIIKVCSVFSNARTYGVLEDECPGRTP